MVDPSKRITIEEIMAHEWLSGRIDMPTTPLMTPNILDTSVNYVGKAFQVALHAYHKARTVTLMDVASAPLAKRRKLKHSSTERSPSTGSSSSDKSTQDLDPPKDVPRLDMKRVLRKRPHKCENEATQHEKQANRKTKKSKEKELVTSCSDEVFHCNIPTNLTSNPLNTIQKQVKFSYHDGINQTHGLNAKLQNADNNFRESHSACVGQSASFGETSDHLHVDDQSTTDFCVNRTVQSSSGITTDCNTTVRHAPGGLVSVITIRTEPCSALCTQTDSAEVIPSKDTYSRGVQWVDTSKQNLQYIDDVRNNNVTKPVTHIDLSTTAWSHAPSSTTSRK